MTNIVYATANPGKFSEVQKIFAHHNIKIKQPSDFNAKVAVDETGTTLYENARLKAEAYLEILPEDTVIIGDDTGVEIDALGGEPGIRVRRWNSPHMSDEEIIEYCLKRLEGVPYSKRSAKFHTVLAIAKKSQSLKYFDGYLSGEILESAQPEREEGMPFWPIFYIPNLKMSLGEFHKSSMEFQITHPTHRELAVLKALPYLISVIK